MLVKSKRYKRVSLLPIKSAIAPHTKPPTIIPVGKTMFVFAFDDEKNESFKFCRPIYTELNNMPCSYFGMCISQTIDGIIYVRIFTTITPLTPAGIRIASNIACNLPKPPEKLKD